MQKNAKKMKNKANATISINDVCWINANWPSPKNIRAFTTNNNIGYGDINHDCGRFNISNSAGDVPDVVKKNRRLLKDFIGEYNGKKRHILYLNQVHGNKVVTSCDYKAHKTSFEADASYSNDPLVVCAIQTADCLPIVICNKEVIAKEELSTETAVIHGGWRSLYADIIGNTLKHFKSPKENLLVWLGPAICSEHYEVDIGFYDNFIKKNTIYRDAFTKGEPGHYFCNLYEIAKIDLINKGIKKENIFKVNNGCTFNNSNLYSYRRQIKESRKTTGRILTACVLN